MKKVSIIIPVYNRKLLVKKAINAALNQTYKNIEIIVINDGSTDGTKTVIEKIAKSHHNIKIINQKNQGVTFARKVGLQNASGDFIIFQDSDDIINDIYVEELLKVQKINDANVVIARRAQILNKFMTIKYTKFPRTFNISENPSYLAKIWLGLTCKMFKKNKIIIPDYGLKANEDLAFMYCYLAKQEKFACSNKALYTTGISHNSLARDFIYGNLDHIDNTIRPLEIEYNLFKENEIITKYSLELEAVFIKNIMERIVNIRQSKEPRKVQDKLIGILLNYLSSRFPDWRQNKYLQRRFVGFPFDSFFYLNLALPTALKTSEVASGELDTVEMFKKTLRREK